MEKEKIQQIAQDISKMVNRYGGKEDTATFVQEVMRDHRTLQQATFEVFLSCIQAWAEAYKADRYDARNEYTCKLCAKIMEAIKDDWFGRVPCI